MIDEDDWWHDGNDDGQSMQMVMIDDDDCWYEHYDDGYGEN